jgi:hypothetical protein
LQYSRVEIQFSLNHKDPLSFSRARLQGILEGPARKAAHLALNHFLDVYRFEMKDASVRRLTWREFHFVRDSSPLVGQAFLFDADGAQIHGLAGFLMDAEPISAGRPKMPSEEQLSELRGLLTKGVEPGLAVLLLLDAEMRRRSEDHRGAVIDAAMAYDISVERVAKRLLVATGATPEEAESRLERMNTAKILHTVLTPNLRMPNGETPGWEAWTRDLKNLRNAVVHDGRLPSEDQAREAIAGATAAVTFLRTLAIGKDEETNPATPTGAPASDRKAYRKGAWLARERGRLLRLLLSRSGASTVPAAKASPQSA